MHDSLRVTGLITALHPSEIFVFGSNEAGHHGKGAAKLALGFGAKRGIGFGLVGSTFAIPTKDCRIRTLPLNRIAKHVAEFIAFAETRTELTFLVTEIGCGLAGYTPNDIAPLFANARSLTNVHLPASFWKTLSTNTKKPSAAHSGVQILSQSMSIRRGELAHEYHGRGRKRT